MIRNDDELADVLRQIVALSMESFSPDAELTPFRVYTLGLVRGFAQAALTVRPEAFTGRDKNSPVYGSEASPERS